ncbi:hypothetical protein HDU97_008646 [Phlyctochytrium planicorne]|nr:hypothetical protein HDU97_008646 [Phlyctochytrium planicorne]
MDPASKSLSTELDRLRKLQLSAAWDHLNLGADNLEESLGIDEEDEEAFAKDTERFTKKIGDVNILSEKLKEATEAMRKFHTESRAMPNSGASPVSGGAGPGAAGRHSTSNTYALNTPMSARSRHPSSATQR